MKTVLFLERDKQGKFCPKRGSMAYVYAVPIFYLFSILGSFFKVWTMKSTQIPTRTKSYPCCPHKSVDEKKILRNHCVISSGDEI